MLAVGDALALCLMKRRGFKIEDYAKFHPAGALGKKSSPISDFMRKGESVAIVDPELSVGQTLLAITNARSGAAVVRNPDNTVAGIFCDGDLRRGLERDQQIMQKPVQNFMTKNCRVVTGDMVAGAVMEIMREKRIAEIPVTDANNHIIGMADLKGLLASL
jgi:arabinose-5-phosphate isomerase